jgi:hypothetical protein
MSAVALPPPGPLVPLSREPARTDGQVSTALSPLGWRESHSESDLSDVGRSDTCA